MPAMYKLTTLDQAPSSQTMLICLQDHFFKPVLGQMVKLVFLSSGVHQIIFSIKSTLPFAVGQVQDVGLIFLSAMATSVVDACSKAGTDSDTTLGTVLVTLLLTTFLVGVLIILTGVLPLTHAVSHMPGVQFVLSACSSCQIGGPAPHFFDDQHSHL